MDLGSFSINLRDLGWTLAAVLVVPGMTQADDVLDSLVAAERAFSARSVEISTRTAFLEFMADRAVVFSPGPVNAQKLWRARPESESTLIWGPSFAEVSAAADLGLSLGPFEFRPPPGSAGQIVHGHFISVWGREADGPWRVWIDIGSLHAPQMPVDDITFVAGPRHPDPPEPPEPRSGWSAGGRVSRGGLGLGLGIDSYVAPRSSDDAARAHAIHQMMTAERTYGFELGRFGMAQALRAIAAEDVRVFRSGAVPLVGLGQAAVGKGATRVRWVPKGSEVSTSYDLGYSYGIVIRRARASAKPDSGVYLHVWRNIDANGWQLVVDVENPLPRR